MGNQREKSYDSKALENLGANLAMATPRIGGDKFPPIKVNMEGLAKAVRKLSKEDRESVERFWGLTGGPKHSQKVGLANRKDIAFQDMLGKASKSVRKLYSITSMEMYDDNLGLLIQRVSKKINNNATRKVDDLEAIKYLVGFFIFICNGPRMSYEEDLLSDDSADYGDATCDEYAMLKDACLLLDDYPDKAVNLQLLISLIEMMEFQDMLVIKKSIGLDISEDCKGVGIKPKEIESAQTFKQIRQIKEKIFGRGAWEVTSNLIIGNPVEVEDFIKELNKIWRHWDEIEKHKAGEKQIRISSEIRTLDVYRIGELEFTDPDEICFLYLSRELMKRT